MSTPLFSILLPTRDRPDTFVHALATLTAQQGDDFEIVVADNASSPEVKAAVDAVTTCPITYLRSDEVLPMTENWNRGLQACKGQYITVVGDDDGLMPDALVVLRRIITSSSAKLISWRMHSYWWPDTIVEFQRNRLYLTYSAGVQGNQVPSRQALESFYNNGMNFGDLPMIYNSFVHRDILEKTKELWGAYIPLQHVPDVASGILNLYLTESYVICLRPLAMRGNSGKSNGTSFYSRSRGADLREKYYKEQRAKLEGLIHSSLIPSPNLHILIASIKLQCRELGFPDDPALKVDMRQLIELILGSLNSEPEAYNDNLADALALGKKFGVTIDTSKLPERAPVVEQVAHRGIWPKEDGFHVVAIDGELAGISDINGACRLASSLIPSIGEA